MLVPTKDHPKRPPQNLEGWKRTGRTQHIEEVSTYRPSRDPHGTFVSLAIKAKPKAIGNRPKARL